MLDSGLAVGSLGVKRTDRSSNTIHFFVYSDIKDIKSKFFYSKEFKKYKGKKDDFFQNSSHYSGSAHHIKRCMMSICPIIDDVTFHCPCKVVSATFFHCHITIFHFTVNKYLMGRFFVMMEMSYSSSNFPPMSFNIHL